MEGLNNMLITAQRNKWIRVFKVNNTHGECLEITHLLYADDAIILCDVDVDQMKILIIILTIFEGISGLHQCVGILGGEMGSLLTTYLGMSLGANSRSKGIWNEALEKCKKKLSRWKSQYIFLGGRLIMSPFPIHPQVEKRMAMPRSNFLWQGNKEKGGVHLVKWRKLTLNKQPGGIGIRNLRKHKQSMLMMWLWRYTNEEQSLWKKVIKEKYGEEDAWKSNTVNAVYGVNVWRTIRSLWQIVSINTSSLKVGNGQKTFFWEDNWSGSGRLRVKFPAIFLLNQQQRAKFK
ncbi:unnamed protein product [Withania somnifera]